MLLLLIRPAYCSAGRGGVGKDGFRFRTNPYHLCKEIISPLPWYLLCEIPPSDLLYRNSEGFSGHLFNTLLIRMVCSIFQKIIIKRCTHSKSREKRNPGCLKSLQLDFRQTSRDFLKLQERFLRCFHLLTSMSTL